MPGNTRRLKYSEADEPWADLFLAYTSQIDDSLFAVSENHNLVARGGGTFSWSAGGGTVSWTAPIDFVGFVSGFKATLPGPDSASLVNDGEVLYIEMPRFLKTNVIVSPLTANKLIAANTLRLHDRIVVAARLNGVLVFSNGLTLQDGDTSDILEGEVPGLTGSDVTKAQVNTVVAQMNACPIIEPPFTEEFFDGAGFSVGGSVLNLINNTASGLQSVHVYRRGLRQSTGDMTVNLAAGTVTFSQQFDAQDSFVVDEWLSCPIVPLA
jgi:hypothetical protein